MGKLVDATCIIQWLQLFLLSYDCNSVISALFISYISSIFSFVLTLLSCYEIVKDCWDRLFTWCTEITLQHLFVASSNAWEKGLFLKSHLQMPSKKVCYLFLCSYLQQSIFNQHRQYNHFVHPLIQPTD